MALTLINTSFSPSSGVGTSLRTSFVPWSRGHQSYSGSVTASNIRTSSTRALQVAGISGSDGDIGAVMVVDAAWSQQAVSS